MKSSNTITEVLKAIGNARNEMKGYLHKGTTVGMGRSSYQSVNDEQTRLYIRPFLQKHDLIIMPVNIQQETSTDIWTEYDKWEKADKRKRQNTTKVLVTYKVCHLVSGEWIEVQSFGIGVDQADKGAGKAQTYALKTLILDLFYIVKGKDEDGERTHSDTYEVPQEENNEVPQEDTRTLVSTPEQIQDLKVWIGGKKLKGLTKQNIFSILNQNTKMPPEISTDIKAFIEEAYKTD